MCEQEDVFTSMRGGWCLGSSAQCRGLKTCDSNSGRCGWSVRQAAQCGAFFVKCVRPVSITRDSALPLVAVPTDRKGTVSSGAHAGVSPVSLMSGNLPRGLVLRGRRCVLLCRGLPRSALRSPCSPTAVLPRGSSSHCFLLAALLGFHLSSSRRAPCSSAFVSQVILFPPFSS